MAKSPDALALLESLDPDALQEQINALQTELDGLVAEKQKQIDALRTLWRSANIRKNGRPARKKRQPKKDRAAEPAEPVQAEPSVGSPSAVEQIAEYLRENMDSRATRIAGDLHMDQKRIDQLLSGNPHRFEHKYGRWRLKE